VRQPKPIGELLDLGLDKAVEVGECLEWRGSYGNKGATPVVKSREGFAYTAAHSVCRMVWEREHGPIPEGKIVYRKCCNNCCVAIEHLAVGTRAQWQANRKKQGKTKHSAAHKAAITLGTRARANIVNSTEKARQVRELAGQIPQKEIAALNKAWADHSNPFTGLIA
jgi:hypothetical protein